MVNKYGQRRKTYRLHVMDKDIFYRAVKTVATGYSETSQSIYHVHGVTSKKDNKFHNHYRQNLITSIKFFVMNMSSAGLSASF
jgi:hypothetical protein